MTAHDQHGAASERAERGIECPRCGCRHFHVLYTRRSIGGRIQRRRECRHCGYRLTTIEHAVGPAGGTLR